VTLISFLNLYFMENLEIIDCQRQGFSLGYVTAEHFVKLRKLVDIIRECRTPQACKLDALTKRTMCIRVPYSDSHF
jgi:hypothetical protein